MSGRGKTPASRKSTSQQPVTQVITAPTGHLTIGDAMLIPFLSPYAQRAIISGTTDLEAARKELASASALASQALTENEELTTANQALASEKDKFAAEIKKLTEDKNELIEKNKELAKKLETSNQALKDTDEMAAMACSGYEFMLGDMRAKLKDTNEKYETLEALLEKVLSTLNEAQAEMVIQKFLTLVQNSLSTQDSSEKLAEDLKKIEGAIAFESSVVSIKDDKGRTALHIACDNNNLKVAKCILEVAPESFFLTNKEGYTAIEQAVINNNEAMFIFLFYNRKLQEKIYAEQGLLTTKLMKLAANSPASEINHYQTNNNNAVQDAPSSLLQKLKKCADEERACYKSWLNDNCTTSEIGHRALDKAISTLDKKQIRVAVKAMVTHGLLPVTSKLTVSSEHKNQMVTRKNDITETATEYMHYKAGRYASKK